MLKEAGLPVSGKKDDLIARLQAHDEASAGAEDAPAEEEQAGMDLDEPVPADDPAPVEPTPAEPTVEEAPVVEPLVEQSTSNGNHPREDEVVEEARPAKRARREEESAPEVAVVEEPVVEVVVEESVPIIETEVVEEVVAVEEETVAAVVEEEEPPVYNFEPEVVDLSASDMYLDTVNRFPLEFHLTADITALDQSQCSRL